MEEVPITYYKNTNLERAIEHLFVEVDRAHRDGADILILTDRGVDENHVPIPSLLAVSAVHQHLVKTKKRTSLAIVLESGEPQGGTPLCHTFGIWSLCDQSIFGTGDHTSVD